MIVSVIHPESRRLLARMMFTSPARSGRVFMYRVYKQLRGPHGAGIIHNNPLRNAGYVENRRYAAMVARMLFNGMAKLDCEIPE